MGLYARKTLLVLVVGVVAACAIAGPAMANVVSSPEQGLSLEVGKSSWCGFASDGTFLIFQATIWRKGAVVGDRNSPEDGYENAAPSRVARIDIANTCNGDGFIELAGAGGQPAVWLRAAPGTYSVDTPELVQLGLGDLRPVWFEFGCCWSPDFPIPITARLAPAT